MLSRQNRVRQSSCQFSSLLGQYKRLGTFLDLPFFRSYILARGFWIGARGFLGFKTAISALIIRDVLMITYCSALAGIGVSEAVDGNSCGIYKSLTVDGRRCFLKAS
jgi:hypothetical protein